jgi:methyl-accepting chemotaxis protein/methyl-accepting chemotaxis protein-1 (serine sensor receptor)
LEALVKQTSADLRAELAGAVASSIRQRRLALGFFLVTLLVAGLVVHFTIQRAIRSPLNQVASRLSASSQKIAIASKQLSAASDALTRNASKQAASLQETSVSSEEVNSTARSNAQKAGQARGLMQEAGQIFQAVNSAHSDLVHAMDEIGQSSARISKIIKVIDEIAFQTNILALNAAVEAARAGAAGMGFAVVADEVRTLAQRSTQAARDTATLIEESVSRATAGQTRMETVTRLLSTNAEIAGKVTVLVDEISCASEEQARGMAQISGTVRLTSEGTQQTAASAERSASSVDSMSAQVRELNDVVEHLNAMIGG